MSFDAERLYQLLPEIYRVRDAERALPGGQPGTRPLEALLQVLAQPIAVLEEDLEQLLDDLFVETAAPWALPYLADLIGVTGLPVHVRQLRPRAEVANTIGYRRRKGTAAMLEQLARDVTGLEARVVEFFQLLCTTQHMNHLRPDNQSWLGLRDPTRLEQLGTPFEHRAGHRDLPHVADVRRIGSRRGRYNIPNVGLFLWRLRPHPITDSLARAVPASELPAAAMAGRCFTFHPLGGPLPLFNLPVTEVETSHLAEPANVPDPITRRALQACLDGEPRLDHHYGRGASLVVADAAGDVRRDQVRACDLSDWSHEPGVGIAIDPVLGRIKFAGAPGTPVRLLEIRAADKARPTLICPQPLSIAGPAGAQVTLDGLLIAGQRNGTTVAGGVLAVTGAIDQLTLRHVTLVPGRSVDAAGVPVAPGQPSLNLGPHAVRVVIERSIVGAVWAPATAEVRISDSLIDGNGAEVRAYAGDDAGAFGAPLELRNVTVVGRVRAVAMPLAENVLFVADASGGQPPVAVQRRQEGCVRFSYVPPGSLTPRRDHCQPAGGAAHVRPVFTSLRWGDPGYGQLSSRTPLEIRRGGADESEMGVFHDLLLEPRVAHLRARLDEYLRLGLEAGIFYVT